MYLDSIQWAIVSEDDTRISRRGAIRIVQQHDPYSHLPDAVTGLDETLGCHNDYPAIDVYRWLGY